LHMIQPSDPPRVDKSDNVSMTQDGFDFIHFISVSIHHSERGVIPYALMALYWNTQGNYFLPFIKQFTQRHVLTFTVSWNAVYLIVHFLKHD
jgi:hypothetical protein